MARATLIALDEPSDLHEHVVDAGLFEDDASGATGDDAGTGGGRLHQHATGAELMPMIGWVMVLPASGTSKRFFFASSVPFWIASGTSLALP